MIKLNDPKIDLGTPIIDLTSPKINFSTSGPDTQALATRVLALLALNIADPIDRKRIRGAMEFLRMPTGDFGVLSKHLEDIAESLAMAEAMGEPLPDAISDIHAHLIRLEVRHHIDAATAAFGAESHDSAEVTHLLILARDAAKILADGYKDSMLLQEVEGLIVQILVVPIEQFREDYKRKKIR